jgi:hypothetical protein
MEFVYRHRDKKVVRALPLITIETLIISDVRLISGGPVKLSHPNLFTPCTVNPFDSSNFFISLWLLCYNEAVKRPIGGYRQFVAS